MKKKLQISKKDLKIVKGFFTIQILLEILDEIQNETSYNLKGATNNYLNSLKIKAEPILLNTYKSNPLLYEKIVNDLRKSIDKIEENFEIKK